MDRLTEMLNRYSNEADEIQQTINKSNELISVLEWLDSEEERLLAELKKVRKLCGYVNYQYHVTLAERLDRQERKLADKILEDYPKAYYNNSWVDFWYTLKHHQRAYTPKREKEG